MGKLRLWLSLCPGLAHRVVGRRRGNLGLPTSVGGPVPILHPSLLRATLQEKDNSKEGVREVRVSSADGHSPRGASGDRCVRTDKMASVLQASCLEIWFAHGLTVPWPQHSSYS